MWRTYIVGARPSLQPICQVTRANNQIRTATETYTVSGSPISTSTPRNSQKLESHCYSVPHFTHRRRKVGLGVCVMVEMMHWQLSPSARTTDLDWPSTLDGNWLWLRSCTGLPHTVPLLRVPASPLPTLLPEAGNRFAKVTKLKMARNSQEYPKTARYTQN